MPVQHALPTTCSDFMNDEHQAIADIHQQLSVALSATNTSDNFETIDHLLQILMQHCQIHFAHEESEMKTTNFPHLDAHQTEHNLILSTSQEVIENWHQLRDIAAVKEYFSLTFATWFKGHIETMDCPTAEFINSENEEQRQKIIWQPAG